MNTTIRLYKSSALGYWFEFYSAAKNMYVGYAGSTGIGLKTWKSEKAMLNFIKNTSWKDYSITRNY